MDICTIGVYCFDLEESFAQCLAGLALFVGLEWQKNKIDERDQDADDHRRNDVFSGQIVGLVNQRSDPEVHEPQEINQEGQQKGNQIPIDGKG